MGCGRLTATTVPAFVTALWYCLRTATAAAAPRWRHARRPFRIALDTHADPSRPRVVRHSLDAEPDDDELGAAHFEVLGSALGSTALQRRRHRRSNRWALLRRPRGREGDDGLERADGGGRDAMSETPFARRTGDAMGFFIEDKPNNDDGDGMEDVERDTEDGHGTMGEAIAWTGHDGGLLDVAELSAPSINGRRSKSFRRARRRKGVPDSMEKAFPWSVRVQEVQSEMSRQQDLLTYECNPGYALERYSPLGSHGDICRNETDRYNWTCPKGCRYTDCKQPPRCVWPNGASCHESTRDYGCLAGRYLWHLPSNNSGDKCFKFHSADWTCPIGCDYAPNRSFPYCLWNDTGGYSIPCRNGTKVTAPDYAYVAPLEYAKGGRCLGGFSIVKTPEDCERVAHALKYSYGGVRRNSSDLPPGCCGCPPGVRCPQPNNIVFNTRPVPTNLANPTDQGAANSGWHSVCEVADTTTTTMEPTEDVVDSGSGFMLTLAFVAIPMCLCLFCACLHTMITGTCNCSADFHF